LKNCPAKTGQFFFATFLYFLEKMEKAHLIGLQVASIGGGELIWEGSYGVKEYATDRMVNDSTLFMIASCSKPVTALGIMKLYDRGLLDLDDAVNDYLPFEVFNPHFPDSVITIRMLLSHTSSLKDNWDVLSPLYTLPEGGDSPLELAGFVRDYFSEGGSYYLKDKNFFTQNPCSEYHYCNMGYALLGVVTEEISHDNIARPHRVHPSPEKAPRDPEILSHYGYPSFPDGQLRTTVTDYAQVLKLFLNEGKIDGEVFLSKPSIQEFLKVQFPRVERHSAIAWNYSEFESFLYYLLMPRLPSHTGADPGVATAVSFDPEKGNGGIIFTNSPTITFGADKILYQEMMKKLLREGNKVVN